MSEHGLRILKASRDLFPMSDYAVMAFLDAGANVAQALGTSGAPGTIP